MRALVLSLALLASTSVLAQTAAPPANWRSMTKEQLNALSKEQIAGFPFVEYLLKTDPKTRRDQLEAILAVTLSKLYFAFDRPMYPFGPYIDAAAREFQGDIGARQDGIIKAGEFDEISRRVNAVNEIAVPTYAPFKRDLYVQDDFLSFGGTWVIEGENHAFPVNFTQYNCYRSMSRCYTSEGYVHGGNGSASLNVEGGSLKVIKWDQTEVLMEDDVRCRVSTISVNLQSKEVYMITRNRDAGCPQAIPVPKLAKPRISRLVDGWEASSQAHRDKTKAVQAYYSKRMQEAMKVLKD